MCRQESDLQYKRSDRHAAFRSANAYLEAGEVLPPLHVLHDAAHAVVPAVAALGSKPHFAQGQVQVIVYHQHLLW